MHPPILPTYVSEICSSGNCLSYNPKWTLPDITIWCIYPKSSILMLQNDTVAKYFRLELAEIGDRNLYEMYFRHTVLCMTSDYILRYVGTFCKGSKHLGVGSLTPSKKIIFFDNFNFFQGWGYFHCAVYRRTNLFLRTRQCPRVRY
jgi:hypothetical protein